MTAPYTAAAAIRGLKADAFAKHNAKVQKYHLRAGNMYLHQSGKHLQPGKLYAWSGTIEQPRNMRRDYPAAAGCKAHRVMPEIVLNSMEA